DWTPVCARKVLAMEDPHGRVEREIAEAENFGIAAITRDDEGFPAAFEKIYDPPFVLWRMGEYLIEDEKAIAVIGCRKPSLYGEQAALKLGEDIVKAGYTVVSGLARGIDS